MSVSYKITINGSQKDALTVDIGSIPALAVPSHIALSILPSIKKIGRIAEYYGKVFTSADSEKGEFRHAVATINKAAKDKGTLNIVCKHKLAEVHTKSFIKFLSDNSETIDMLTPYLLGEGYKAANQTGDENMTLPTAQEPGSAPSVTALVDPSNPEAGQVTFTGDGIERLTQDDLSQIAKLMHQNDINNIVEHTSTEAIVPQEQVEEDKTEEVEKKEETTNDNPQE